MFCTKCGNEIKQGSAFCAKCGKPVKNDNIKKNAEVKNDKESKNNYDIKKTESLSLGKVAIGIIILIIVIAVGTSIYNKPISSNVEETENKVEENIIKENTTKENKNDTENTFTTVSDNTYGMRFNKNISEFCEDFNKSLESEYEQLGEDTTAIGLYTLESSDFSCYGTVQGNMKEYYVEMIGYTIMLFTESDSNYIVYACVGYNPNSVANASKMLSFLSSKVYPAIISGLTDMKYTDVLNTLSEANNDGLFKNNVCYTVITDASNNTMMYVYAISKEKYKEFMK